LNVLKGSIASFTSLIIMALHAAKGKLIGVIGDEVSEPEREHFDHDPLARTPAWAFCWAASAK